MYNPDKIATAAENDVSGFCRVSLKMYFSMAPGVASNVCGFVGLSEFTAAKNVILEESFLMQALALNRKKIPAE
jgi:hypothetical protein